MPLSPDLLAIPSLCSHLGLPAQPEAIPLTLREWNPSARKTAASPLARPAALPGMISTDLITPFDLSEAEGKRLLLLVRRRETLTTELDCLIRMGIWVLSRADQTYIAHLRQRLKDSAPTVFFRACETALVDRPGLTLVGSRDVNKEGQTMAEFIGIACTSCGLEVSSGGAHSRDSLVMYAARKGRGTAVGVLAKILEKTMHASAYRPATGRRGLTLHTPYNPNAGFSVGAAMERYILICALADTPWLSPARLAKGESGMGPATRSKRAGCRSSSVRARTFLRATTCRFKKGDYPSQIHFPNHHRHWASGWQPIPSNPIPHQRNSTFSKQENAHGIPRLSHLSGTTLSP